MKFNLSEIKAGDIVLRLLAGKVPVKLKVTAVTDSIINCGGGDGWNFSRLTGAEEDDYMEWGDQHGKTGSFLACPTCRKSQGACRCE